MFCFVDSLSYEHSFSDLLRYDEKLGKEKIA